MNFLLAGQESERIYYRKLEQSDFPAWLEFCKHPSATQYLNLTDDPNPEVKCKLWFDRMRLRYENNNGMNVLIDKKSGELIGQCGLLIQTVDEIEELEIGYAIMPQFWNMGFAKEASKKCRDYAFQNNLSETLVSVIHEKNINSEKVALANGMRLEKKTVWKNMPVNVFRIKKSDWT